MVKHLPTMPETRVRSLDREDPLEKEMATHSSTLAWRIPWTKVPGRLQSMGLQRVRHDWVTSLHFIHFQIKPEVYKQEKYMPWNCMSKKLNEIRITILPQYKENPVRQKTWSHMCRRSYLSCLWLILCMADEQRKAICPEMCRFGILKINALLHSSRNKP